jgi:hypothetical protein
LNALGKGLIVTVAVANAPTQPLPEVTKFE